MKSNLWFGKPSFLLIMSHRVSKKTQEREDLIARILRNGFEMNACSNCMRRNQTCISSADSTKCAGCVRRKVKCDQSGPSHSDWQKLEKEEDRLDQEEEATLAKLLRLRRQKKALKSRGKDMLRRGLKTLDELDAVEERERLEAQALEVAVSLSGPLTAEELAQYDPASLMEEWDVVGETPQGVVSQHSS